MRNTVTVLAVGGFVLATAYATLGAQAATATSQGVYTDEQAARGDALYKEQCAACHGDNLEGSGPMPPLAGQDFLSNWQGKTVGDLFEKTQATMPATAPGVLTGEQTADILAYVLKSSGYPSGTAALASTVAALTPIAVDAPAAVGASAPAPAAGASAASAASAGVYTAEQAVRGDTVYKEQCAACHGDYLEGSGPMPALAGRDFLSNWQGKTVGDLFEKTQGTMPATAPGTLTAQQAADVVAYMLKSSQYPEGATPLPDAVDGLHKIALDVPATQQ